MVGLIFAVAVYLGKLPKLIEASHPGQVNPSHLAAAVASTHFALVPVAVAAEGFHRLAADPPCLAADYLAPTFPMHCFRYSVGLRFSAEAPKFFPSAPYL